MNSNSRLALVLGLVLGLAALHGCSTPSSDPALDTANDYFAHGNYLDALEEYRTYTQRSAEASHTPHHLARFREGLCLGFLERYEEAATAFGQVDEEKLPTDVDRRELHIQRGRVALELARLAEPSFLENTPENAGAIRRGKEMATNHLQVARNDFSLVLTRFNPKDFDALLGKGECYFHLAHLEGNRQAFALANELLVNCRDAEPDNKRALFFLGRVAQEDLGRGNLTREAAKLIRQAVFQDSVTNHDFHVAYRDVYLYLKRFSSPLEIDRAFPGEPQLAADAKELAEYVDRYARHGRHARTVWGRELVTRLEAWLAIYKGWQENANTLTRNVREAEEALRGRGGVYLDAYRRAVSLLDEVAAEQREDEEYIAVRRLAQQGYVVALLDTGERLVELGETQLADQKFLRALELIDRKYISDPGTYLDRAQKGRHLVEVRGEWKVVAARIQTALGTGDLEGASRELDLALSQLGDRRAVLGDEIEQLRREIENPAITDYLSLVASAEANKDKPSEALGFYVQALNLARTNNWTHRAADMTRAVSRAHFDLGDHQRALDAISQVARLGRPPTQSDYVLEGKCLYAKGEFRAGAERFDRVTDKTTLNGNELRIAGLCYLQAANYARCREFLEAAPKQDREVIKGLRECYRELAQGLSGQESSNPRGLIEVLERLVEVDPADYESRRRLGFLLYRIGEEDPAAYQRGYAHILAAQQQGFGPRSDFEKQSFGRLVAYFSDYVPLSAGNEWVYKTSGGQTFEVRVSEELQEGRYRVVTAMGEAKREETWDDAGSVLKRYDSDLKAPVELPVKLRTPTDEPVWQYRVLATRYEARVVATGETCVVGNDIYEHCIKVRISSSAPGNDRVYVFAPGVGEVRMMVGDEVRYELLRKQLSGRPGVLGGVGAASG